MKDNTKLAILDEVCGDAAWLYIAERRGNKFSRKYGKNHAEGYLIADIKDDNIVITFSSVIDFLKEIEGKLDFVSRLEKDWDYILYYEINFADPQVNQKAQTILTTIHQMAWKKFHGFEKAKS